MATHIAGMIRVVSEAETFLGPGGTVNALRKAIGPIAPPEGPFGPLRWFIQRTQAHSHDANYGVVVFTGDLLNYDDGEAVVEYFKAAVKAISDGAIPYVGVNQAVIHIMVDGKPALMLDHFGALIEGLETLGDEAS